jgi:hypothetical protein
MSRNRGSVGGTDLRRPFVRLISTKLPRKKFFICSTPSKLTRNSPCIYHASVPMHHRLSVLTSQYFYTSQWHQASVLLTTRATLAPWDTCSKWDNAMRKLWNRFISIGCPFFRQVTVESLATPLSRPVNECLVRLSPPRGG